VQLLFGTGSAAALRGKAQALPLPLKLANLQSELATERKAFSEQQYDSRIANAAAQLEETQLEYQQLVRVVSELRRNRDSLTVASQAVTRLRIAQESLGELHAQVCSMQFSRHSDHCNSLLFHHLDCGQQNCAAVSINLHKVCEVLGAKTMGPPLFEWLW
jgi:hypothetical protein